ncbi:hypothetical protein DV736_g3065, partial [Chaetothyriales sp. CBS 134916]
MVLVSATSVAGAVLILYLASFVLLASLRIATGISIQRIGYFSLRHIPYSPREGVQITLRGLGLHRPTFARRTWISLVLTDLRATIDPASLDSSSAPQADGASRGPGSGLEKPAAGRPDLRTHGARSEVWQKLISVKEKLKRLHTKIKWLRTLDIGAANT